MPRSGTQARQRAYRRGVVSEWVAMAWICCKGYRILSWRYRSPWGEIDCIAQRGSRIAFVEVKARALEEDALTSIAAGQRRIAQAAESFLAQRGLAKLPAVDIGFDAIIIRPWRLPKHIPNAWRLS